MGGRKAIHNSWEIKLQYCTYLSHRKFVHNLQYLHIYLSISLSVFLISLFPALRGLYSPSKKVRPEYVHIYPQAPQSLYSPPYLLSSLLSIYVHHFNPGQINVYVYCVLKIMFRKLNFCLFGFPLDVVVDATQRGLNNKGGQCSSPLSPFGFKRFIIAQITPEAKMGKLC